MEKNLMPKEKLLRNNIMRISATITDTQTHPNNILSLPIWEKKVLQLSITMTLLIHVTKQNYRFIVFFDTEMNP